MYRLPPAFLAGIFTTGALPKAPVAVTDAFGLAGGEDDDDDEPQPARAAVAISGTKSAAAMRRMGILIVGIKSAASLPAAAGTVDPGSPARPQARFVPGLTCRRSASRPARQPSGTGPCTARSAAPGRSASGAPSPR